MELINKFVYWFAHSADSLSVETVTFIILPLAIWQTVWMVLALVKAYKLHDWKWFVVIALIRTVGILDIIYIYKISKRKEYGQQ